MIPPLQMLRIFISWSGEPAGAIAKSFHEYLPYVIDAINPFLSGEMDKGTRWQEVLTSELQITPCAIVCLTHESLAAPWVAFETGAISRAAGGPDGAKTRIWPFLFGITKGDIATSPYGSYQSTQAEESETLRLITSINRLSPAPVSPEVLKVRFNKMFWPEFSALLEQLKAVKSAVSTPAPPTNQAELLQEVLRTVRAMQTQNLAQAGLRTPNEPLTHARLKLDLILNTFPHEEEAEAYRKKIEQLIGCHFTLESRSQDHLVLVSEDFVMRHWSQKLRAELDQDPMLQSWWGTMI